MKNIIRSLAVVAFAMVGLVEHVSAEAIKLGSAADIIGTWEVTAEAIKYNGEKKALNTVWEFKPGGELLTTSKDPRTETIRVPLTYTVEDGLINKQSVPGRQKFETCEVLRKDGNSMDIKCKFLYFFLTKK